MAAEESKSPKNESNPSKRCNQSQTPGDKHGILSPRFRSAAAMAGWDEEALLLASLVVEDTPEREPKHQRRSIMRFKTPPTNSKRKRRSQRQSPTPIAAVILSLDEEETPREVHCGLEEKREKADVVVVPEAKTQGSKGNSPEKATPSVVLPCMDRLREELSCAICLDICFEPSTTPCGHSFCKKCLKNAAAKCGKRCPKCRQLISHGRSCTVNTVLWNTIQLLFPEEVETRKKALEVTSSSSQSYKSTSRSPIRESSHNTRSSSIRTTTNNNIRSSHVARIVDRDRNLRRRASPTQLEDAALALRLQRQEFMEVFRETRGTEEISTVNTARANLRAMASRAIQIRSRNRFL